MSHPESPSHISFGTRRFIKVLGERNTGSGFLERLLFENFLVERLSGGFPKILRQIFPHSERARDCYFLSSKRRNLGWKHAAAPSRETLASSSLDLRQVLFITLTKNPYAWLLSLYRQPYHAKRKFSSFEDFLSTPWETVDRENSPTVFANPVELWNYKNSSYLALGEYATTEICRYEDLLSEPFAFLSQIHSDYGFALRQKFFRNVLQATKGRDRGKSFEDYRDYYLNLRWRNELGNSDLTLINESLDNEVMSRLRYDWIETATLSG